MPATSTSAESSGYRVLSAHHGVRCISKAVGSRRLLSVLVCASRSTSKHGEVEDLRPQNKTR